MKGKEQYCFGWEMKRIALIGAFDRYNYGDVFMPIVFQEINKDKEYEYELFGTRKIDMKFCGGLPCEKLGVFYQKYNSFDAIIVVGGQCLGCGYGNAWLSTMDEDFDISTCFDGDRKKISKHARKEMGGISFAPWVIKPFSKKPIIYNTVGGNVLFADSSFGFSGNIANWKYLNKASYLAVRDSYTKKINSVVLRKMKLYPDSVTLISEIIKKDNTDRVSFDIKEKMKRIDNYIVFQVNEAIGGGNEQEYAKQIDSIYAKEGIKSVLLPLGNIYGHGDRKTLSKVFENVKDKEACIMFEFCTIYDVAYIIANASCYIGSSLHGVITSISYAVPHVAVSAGAKKTIRYIETWNTSSKNNLSSNDWADEAIDFINDEHNRKALKEVSKELIKKSYENNANIINIIG